MADTWFVCQEDNMQAALPQCAAFLVFTGQDAIASADRVFVELIKRTDETKEVMTPDQLRSLRPFALVWSDAPQIVRVADSNAFNYGGEMTLVFEIDHDQIESRDPTATTESKRVRWVKNQCGLILQQLFEEQFTIAERTLEMDWHSYSREMETGDPAHVVFYCRFSYGFNVG